MSVYIYIYTYIYIYIFIYMEWPQRETPNRGNYQDWKQNVVVRIWPPAFGSQDLFARSRSQDLLARMWKPGFGTVARIWKPGSGSGSDEKALVFIWKVRFGRKRMILANLFLPIGLENVAVAAASVDEGPPRCSLKGLKNDDVYKTCARIIFFQF